MEGLIRVVGIINILLGNHIYNLMFKVLNIILLNFIFFLIIDINVLGNLKVSSFFGVEIDN